MPNPKRWTGKKRVAIYARVSTTEGKQTPETQLRELREYAKRRGFEVAGEYVDHATGRTENREEYQRLLEDVRRRKVDVVLVWRYDRFARSVQALINALTEFKALGVDFISLSEHVDTTTPQGELIFGIMASLAQFESRLIGERVTAGMARAKSEGKHVGRKALSPALQDEIRTLARDSHSSRTIAKRLGVSHPTVLKYLKSSK